MAFTNRIFIEEATTNLLVNPSFETNTTGWTGLTQNGSFAKFGSYSASGTGNVTTSGSITSGTRYQFTAYLRADSNVSGLISTGTTSGNFSITSDWTRQTLSFVASGATGFHTVNISGAGAFYVDGAQLEAKNNPTTYTDGSLGSGYWWTGTAHASTSQRSGSQLSYPAYNNISSSSGTLLFWFNRNTQLTGNPRLAGVTIDSNNETSIIFRNGSGLQIYENSGGSATFIAPTANNVTNGTWIHTGIGWSGSSIQLYINGVSGANGTYTPVAGGTFSGDTLDLGFGGPSAETCNSYIANVQVHNRLLTAAEVSGIYYTELSTPYGE